MNLGDLSGNLPWSITLGAGMVVAVVVTILLQILLLSVIKVERNVKTLWETATTLARNTATTWLLAAVAETIEEIEKEAAGKVAAARSARAP